MSIRLVVASLLSIVVALPLFGQPYPVARQKAVEEAAKDGPVPKYIKEETPEQRRTRLGTVEDPGLDPDPEKVWWRFGHAYKIEKFERQWAAYDQPIGFVRPFAMANFHYEIYQQNDKHVWVWMPEQPAADAPNAIVGDAPALKVTPYTPEQIGYLRMIAPEYEPLSVPAASKKIRFEESSTGLPQSGSWRNSLAVADMNGDGHVDIIAPPERGAGTIPAIYLGDGKGGWTPWHAVIWPYEIQYGSVAATDFNKDKKMDLVFGIHLIGVRVFLGDGKGNFVDGSSGLEGRDFTTRRVRTADVDLDGDTDIIALYEGPAPGREENRFAGGKLRVYLNEKKGTSWRAADVSDPKDTVSGDWMAVGRFNADRYPDFVGSSIYFQGTDVLFRSTGPLKWSKVDPRDGQLIPFLSTYTAVTAAPLSSKGLDDAVVSFARSWPDNIDSSIVRTPSLSKGLVGLDRISFVGKEPKRIPVVRYPGIGQIGGLSSADFDGDGKQDLIFTKFGPREFVILLGDGKGGFSQASLEGITAEKNPTYDITVADVDDDGRQDVLVMYESDAFSSLGKQDGSIRVFLNKGVAPAGAMTADAKP